MKSYCIECKERLTKMDNLVFFQCTWKGEGFVSGEKTERCFSGTADLSNNYITFKHGKKLPWCYLEITTEPLKL